MAHLPVLENPGTPGNPTDVKADLYTVQNPQAPVYPPKNANPYPIHMHGAAPVYPFPNQNPNPLNPNPNYPSPFATESVALDAYRNSLLSNGEPFPYNRPYASEAEMLAAYDSGFPTVAGAPAYATRDAALEAYRQSLTGTSPFPYNRPYATEAEMLEAHRMGYYRNPR